MAAPEKILQLIERFGMFYDQLHSPDYNETELRNEYVNPFFEILGWDVINKQGYSQAYREVIHEAKIKRDDSTKHPDYAFRIGRETKFFVETKKPSVNINKNPNPALQLRSYIWTSKLPLGILTDFEEFAVYDGRFKPIKSDKASTARILYIKYNEYPEKWDKIESIFAKESILKGSFDEYAEKTKAKKGTTEVDDEFLKEISRWREILARNIALRNKKLSTRELNWVVQKTIDRIIFLRITEDREIEEEFQLQKIAEGKNVYQRLRRIFLSADDKYNSGLFHFRKEPDREGTHDELSLNLSIDDNVLKDITKNLYYPDSPYAFAVMPADILGQVYEQFLGKVIRLTPSHQAKVEYKPEVKKAGGVYYTPTYIVDYIVKNTLGKILKDKNPDEVSKIKILDPACGSGSFLIVAYQLLLDWHLEWYSNNNPEKLAKGKNPRIYLSGSGDWMLATVEKKRILLNNIHGVDIDPQAVEVTKLSLLLKVLENENKESIGKQLSFFHKRALPDLGNNIKCGNSLIGSDFYSYNSTSGNYPLFTEDEQYRINAFDWDKEFPQVFVNKPSDAFGATSLAKGGKPSVVSLNKGDVERSETEGSSAPTVPSPDLTVPSPAPTASEHPLPKGEGQLPSPSGRRTEDEGFLTGGFDVVIGNPPYGAFFSQPEKKYVNIKYPASDIETESYLVFIEKSLTLLKFNGFFGYIVPSNLMTNVRYEAIRNFLLKNYNINKLVDLGSGVFNKTSVDTCLIFIQKKRAKDNKITAVVGNIGNEDIQTFIFNQSDFIINPYKIFNIYTEPKVLDLIDKIFQSMPHLSDFVIISRGIEFGYKSKFVSDEKLNKQFKPLIAGRCITRYSLEFENKYICFDEKDISHFKEQSIYITPKILMRRIGTTIIATYDPERFYNVCDVYNIINKSSMSIQYLLGLLNSMLLSFILQNRFRTSKKLFPKIPIITIKQLPIRTIDFSNPADVKKHDRMVSLVDQMLDVQKKIAVAKTEYEKKMLERMRDTIDMQIDELVYKLYELTDEEIKIVESSVK